MKTKPEVHSFSDLQLDMKKFFSLTVDDSTVSEFSNISGDYNPLHMNDEFAKSTKFHKRVCHGMLLGSFFSRLVGMHLPGLNSLYMSQTLNFCNPCFIGDQIIVLGTIKHKSESTKIITLDTQIHNSQGDSLVYGEAKVMFLE